MINSTPHDDFASRKKAALDKLKHFSPATIQQFLDKHIVGSDDVKLALSVAGYKHKRRMSGYKYSHGPYQIIGLQGGTGCGKTYTVKKMAEYLSVPFLHVDCSKLTSEGYVGNSIRDQVQTILAQPNGRYGIVLLDEFDKLADVGENHGAITTVKVQQELLRLFEGEDFVQRNEASANLNWAYRFSQTVCNVSYLNHTVGELEQNAAKLISDHLMKSLQESAGCSTTSDLLFIISGAFSGIKLEDDTKSMGFGASAKEGAKKPSLTSALIEYGIIPELVGRISTLLKVEDMDRDKLFQILHLNSGALHMYEAMFREEGIYVDVTEEAKGIIAEEAYSLGVGARALQNILGRVFRALEHDLFEGLLPDRVTIDADDVKAYLSQYK